MLAQTDHSFPSKVLWGMDLRLVFCWIFLSWVSLSLAKDVKVRVKGVTSIATTDDNFICATVDWWPSYKCDFHQCSWGQSSILNLDLKNKILANAIKAFSPLRIRLGGSLQDQVMYGVGNASKSCPHFKKKWNSFFGISRGCLHMDRWDELNHFFNRTGAKIIFGLNALSGRIKAKGDKNKTLWIGDWNPQNAHDFMKYTISKGYKIDSYEFGNELCSAGVAARLEAEQYAKDTIVLKKLVKDLHPDPTTQPKVLGPAGFFDSKWFSTYLKDSGPSVLDGVTHHVYNLGPGTDPNILAKIKDPYYLDQIAQLFKDITSVIKQFAPWSAPWVGEAAGTWNSGSKTVSHTYVNGFWYLDQLGMTATFNHKVYCRQSLVGGNYPLLNTTTFIPNPDFYGALLWHRLMGKDVLSATQNASPYLRVYAHCSRKKPGISLLLINMSNSTSFNVTISNTRNLHSENRKLMDVCESEQREEYHLTPKDGNLLSEVVLLNGIPLVLTESLDIPALKPKLVVSSSPVTVAHDSIVFVSIKNFHAPACAQKH